MEPENTQSIPPVQPTQPQPDTQQIPQQEAQTIPQPPIQQPTINQTFSAQPPINNDEGTKSFMVAYLLSQFFGQLGLDRFYLGKIGTGVLKLITLGGFGIWSFIDVILILVNHTTSSDGKKLNGYEKNKKLAIGLFILLNFVIPIIFVAFYMFMFATMLQGLSNNKNIMITTNSDLTIMSPTITVVPTQTTIATTDETMGWKAFESKKYAFSIKYPTSLSSQEFLTPFYLVNFKRTNAVQGELSNFDLLASSDTFIAKDPAAYDFLSADIFNTLSAMKTNAVKQISTIIFTKLDDIIINGITATVVNVKSSLDTTTNQKRVYLKTNGNMYLFVNNNEQNQNDFDKFVSSFKLTK